MSAAELVSIKRRIKSVTSTMKITKAMSLVATAKLKRAREQLKLNEGYYSESDDITREIFQNYNKKNIFTDGNECSKKLYLLFTSGMGLCGGFNVEILNRTIGLIQGDRANSEIIIVGKRNKGHLNKFGQDINIEIKEKIGKTEDEEAEYLSQHILDIYLKGEIGEVRVVYTHFISGVKYEVDVQELLPIPYKYDDNCDGLTKFEPGMDILAEKAAKLYITELILHCRLNSSASEQSARMNAMNGATRNAEELLQKLKLKYNRVRQGLITQEISEIIGGAQALR